MKRVTHIAVGLAILLIAANRISAQSVNVAGDMLKEWQDQKMLMVGIADAMPADKFNYKSTPAQRD